MHVPSVPITDAPCRYPAYTHDFRDVAGVRVEVAVGVEEAQKLLPAILTTGTVAVDIETFGLKADRWRLKAVGIGDATGTRVAVLDPRDTRQADLLRDTLDATACLLLHNGSFDAVPLVHTGLMSLDAVDKIIDTIVLARMARPGGSNGLEQVASVIGVKSSGSPWAGLHGSWGAEKWYRTADLGMARYLDGLVADVSVTARIFTPLGEQFSALMAKAPWWGRGAGGVRSIAERELTVSRMMIRSAVIGLPVDLDYADEFRDRYSVDVQLRDSRLTDAGITSSKPSSMAKWLEHSGIADAKWERTETGQIKTAKKLLKPLAPRVPLVADYLTVRNADKVFGYLDTITAEKGVTGRIHPTVNVDAARTGRMSVSGPALQQFPPAARGILLSPYEEGLASIDWSSIEVVVAAALGRDKGMLTAIATGLDPYSLAMDAAGIDRDTAKVVILAGQYGQGIPSLARTLGTDEAEARTVREKVFSSMPGVKALMDAASRLAESGFVSTIAGRAIPIARDGNRFKAYTGMNYIVQGSAYDLLAEALVKIAASGLRDHVCLAVHDELVVSADPDVTQAISEIMSTPPDYLTEFVNGLPLSLKADPDLIGNRWAKPGKSTELTTYAVTSVFDEEDN